MMAGPLSLVHHVDMARMFSNCYTVVTFECLCITIHKKVGETFLSASFFTGLFEGISALMH